MPSLRTYNRFTKVLEQKTEGAAGIAHRVSAVENDKGVEEMIVELDLVGNADPVCSSVRDFVRTATCDPHRNCPCYLSPGEAPTAAVSQHRRFGTRGERTSSTA